MFGQGALGELAIGEPETFGYTIHVSAGAFALSPVPVTLTKGGHRIYTLSGAVNGYLLRPKTANLTYHQRGDVAPGAFTLTPFTSSFVHTGPQAILAAPGAFSIAGSPAGSLRRYVLAPTVGTFALSGNSLTATFRRMLVSIKGDFVITSVAIGTLYSRIMQLIRGGFSLTPKSATLTRTRAIVAAPGAYTLSGSPAFAVHAPLRASSVAFTLAPQTADLRRSRIMNVGTGRYFFNGNPAVRTLAPPPAVFSIVAQPVDLNYSWSKLDAAPGAIVLSAETAQLTRKYTLQAGSGAFLLQDAGSDHSRLYVLDAIADGYAVDAIDAQMTFTRIIKAAPVPFMVQATSAALQRHAVIAPTTGHFNILGRSATSIENPGVAAVTLWPPSTEVDVAPPVAAVTMGEPVVEIVALVPEVIVERLP